MKVARGGAGFALEPEIYFFTHNGRKNRPTKVGLQSAKKEPAFRRGGGVTRGGSTMTRESPLISHAECRVKELFQWLMNDMKRLVISGVKL